MSKNHMTSSATRCLGICSCFSDCQPWETTMSNEEKREDCVHSGWLWTENLVMWFQDILVVLC